MTMTEESGFVKRLWLTIGSTTICGKKVDNFQSRASDSAQATDSFAGFASHASRKAFCGYPSYPAERKTGLEIMAVIAIPASAAPPKNRLERFCLT
jgi:hypothetical protein